MFAWNNIRIDGNNNIVIQDINGDIQTIIFDEFIKQFTSEKNIQIKLLEDKLLDKEEIKNLSDYKVSRLQMDLQRLQDDKKYLENQVQALLLEFSKADISEADKSYREAFELFVNGQLEEAIDVLDEDILLEQEVKIKARQEKQAETRLLKAQLLSIRFDFVGAAYNIEKMVRCLSNYDTRSQASIFYSLLNDYSNAIIHYKQALFLAPDDTERATLLGNLGTVYIGNQLFADAKLVYDEALVIRRNLAKDKPEFLYPMAGLLLSIGTLNNIELRFNDAETNLNEALNILHRVDGRAFLFDYYISLASVLAKLGDVYTKKRQFSKPEELYRNALVLYDVSLNMNPKAFEFLTAEKASCLNNQGYFYQEYGPAFSIEAESAYLRALPMYRELIKKNPHRHNPMLGLLLNNIGNLYGSKEMFDDSIKYLDESLSIRRILTEVNPQAYSSDIAQVIGNLGIAYKKTGKIDMAEKMYNESMNICRELAINNPQIYQLDVAHSAINMGIFYLEALPSRIKSLSFFKEAIQNSYGYLSSVPIANDYIGAALGHVTRWDVNPNEFFNDAIRSIE